jgi:hexosaminidase
MRCPPALLALAVAAVPAPLAARTAAPDSGLTVIPRPDSVVLDSGTFRLADPVRIVVVTPDRRMREIAGLLREWLRQPSGFRVAVVAGRPRRGDIALALDRSAGDGPESYTLTVTPAGVRIAAPAAAGVLWGVQTLRQLLPPAFDDTTTGRADAWPIPAVTIRDGPRFAWRGALLDASRHFFPVAFVKRFVDLLSRYKLNVLHWHLTDDQGWRLEVPAWPLLTRIGAWRTEQDGTRYGGFYSQADVRDVVEYARLRGVTVVPEIEMPGHSVAAIASYPWLGCTGDSIPVADTWGVFADVYCPRENTFGFLEDVLGEVVRLFPAGYVHIGGDEVPKDRWHACADCQALMRSEGLPDENQLQGWFIGRIARWLTAHGRRMIGWDEITTAPLPPGAIVEVWRDTATIAAVARAEHDVIAAPGAYTYLDHSQSGLPLAKVYSFDPMPAGLGADSVHVLGGEAPLWSERITTANFDLMAFPRLLAFAEALWTKGPRDFADFHRRLLAGEEPRLVALGVGIGPESQDVLRMTPVLDSASANVAMRVAAGVPGITVHYTTDGNAPTESSRPYPDSLGFGDPGTVIFQAFYRHQPLGDPRSFTIVPNLARGRPYTLVTPPSPQYPGLGPRTLTDGVIGSLDFHDGFWQGWQGTDLAAVVDLGRDTTVAAVSGSFEQAAQSWVLLPKDFTVWLSDDSTTWRPAGTAKADQPAERQDAFLDSLTVVLPAGTRARWVKVLATNPGPLPAGHPGAGQPSWIFCDQIVVR